MLVTAMIAPAAGDIVRVTLGEAPPIVPPVTASWLPTTLCAPSVKLTDPPAPGGPVGPVGPGGPWGPGGPATTPPSPPDAVLHGPVALRMITLTTARSGRRPSRPD